MILRLNAHQCNTSGFVVERELFLRLGRKFDTHMGGQVHPVTLSPSQPGNSTRTRTADLSHWEMSPRLCDRRQLAGWVGITTARRTATPAVISPPTPQMRTPRLGTGNAEDIGHVAGQSGPTPRGGEVLPRPPHQPQNSGRRGGVAAFSRATLPPAGSAPPRRRPGPALAALLCATATNLSHQATSVITS